ncbi:MBL fold metallo-hydrolase [Saprospiraceae bacterium]|nr:MBL fold metallo-hydrolase [Saprospiraceae bacterium]
MKVEQIYTGCLSQGAYYVESNGEAAIIDPLRETEPYIAKAKANGVKIKYIFETHFHADFVSGHLDLAKKTGAKIIYGPTAQTDYKVHVAKDGEKFKLGKVSIIVLHTPGHTPESSTFLLKDEKKKDYAIFSGDTLFIGDVGRPDLAQKNGKLTKEELAGWLFDSLRNKIMPLNDKVLVYPAHGAGSACGKNMSSETWDTLGNQKKTNYALRTDMTKKEFIKEVTDGLASPPVYFQKNAALNKTGYESIDTVMKRGVKALSPRAFEVAANETEALILDVRSKEEFVKGFIPNSIFIGLDGSFAPWVGALIPDLQQPILIVAPRGKNKETVKRLARVGYDNSIGYLKGGFEAWKKEQREIDKIETINVKKFKKLYTKRMNILDVRKPTEFIGEQIENSQNYPLDFINENMSEISKRKKYYMHCRSGYRSTVAASILKARGFEKLVNVQGKYSDISASKIPTSDFVCPSTLKK